MAAARSLRLEVVVTMKLGRLEDWEPVMRWLTITVVMVLVGYGIWGKLAPWMGAIRP